MNICKSAIITFIILASGLVSCSGFTDKHPNYRSMKTETRTTTDSAGKTTVKKITTIVDDEGTHVYEEITEAGGQSVKSQALTKRSPLGVVAGEINPNPCGTSSDSHFKVITNKKENPKINNNNVHSKGNQNGSNTLITKKEARAPESQIIPKPIQNGETGDELSDYKACGKAVFKLLNDFRATNNLQKVEWSDVIYDEITGHTINMAKTSTLSHDDFELRTANLKRIFKKSNLNVEKSAENVAYFSDSSIKTTEKRAKKFMKNWEKSPGHKANMVLEDAHYAAIDCRHTANGSAWYATMLLTQFQKSLLI